MQDQCSRRAVLAFASALMACLCGGCKNDAEIPLVEFPKGLAPPPAPKDAKKAPQGANTSSGEPAH
jgi:hypothetical protein